MFISPAQDLQHPGTVTFLNHFVDSHCNLWKRKQFHSGSGRMLCYPEQCFPACAQITQDTWPHRFSHDHVSAPACSPEASFYGEGGLGKLAPHCSWKTNNSAKRADAPIKYTIFFSDDLSFAAFFPATVIILNNTNPSHCYQQRGFTVLWRTILKVQTT